jgi:hypothetical protein
MSSSKYLTVACTLALVLSGCSNESAPPSPGTSFLGTIATFYADPAEQAAFRAALDRAAIPYKLQMRDGKEMIHWEDQYNSDVEKIKTHLFGPTIRSNSNISFSDPEQQKAFTNWLTERSVKYDVVRSRGKDYVVWEGPESLRDEYTSRLARKCDETVARAQTKKGSCG